MTELMLPLYIHYKHKSLIRMSSWLLYSDFMLLSSFSFFLSGLPQMLPQLEPPVLQEPLVQMEAPLDHLPPHPIPPAIAGYSRHRPKLKRLAGSVLIF